MMQDVKLIYGTGKRASMLAVVDLLMEMQQAFYYSKKFLRVKTRKQSLTNTLVMEMRRAGLQVRVVRENETK